MKIDSDQLFKDLVANGIGFIRASIESIESNTDLSVVTFGAGLELLLKARLVKEHWSLVFENPAEASVSKIHDGSLRSISASKICGRISSITGENLSAARKEFDEVFGFRNRVLHFLPHPNSDEVVAWQLRAWYQLKRLLDGQWDALFSDFKEQVGELEYALRRLNEYLSTRRAFLAPRIEGLKKAGRVLVCKACEFDGAVLESVELGLRRHECMICESHGFAVGLECGCWVVVGIDEDEVRCKCKASHSIADVASACDTRPLSPKDLLSAGEIEASCGECLRSGSVAPSESGYFCLGCGATFVDGDGIGCCEFCNERWAGLDLEDSYVTGCESCDGALGWES